MYDTKEYRKYMFEWLAANPRGAQFLHVHMPDFYAWLMRNYRDYVKLGT